MREAIHSWLLEKSCHPNLWYSTLKTFVLKRDGIENSDLSFSAAFQTFLVLFEWHFSSKVGWFQCEILLLISRFPLRLYHTFSEDLLIEALHCQCSPWLLNIVTKAILTNWMEKPCLTLIIPPFLYLHLSDDSTTK